MTTQKPANRDIRESAQTLQEIADMMGLTKERVRQIEAKALAHFRQKLYSLGHKPSDLISER